MRALAGRVLFAVLLVLVAFVAAFVLTALAPGDEAPDDGLSTRIAWMAEQGIGRAELRVNPDHAGPIEVRLQMEGTRLVAEFSAVNADTRQALEAGMHRLRDMLGQQGLQLAQSHVGSGGGQGRQDGSGGGTAGSPGHADGSDIAAGDTAPARWVSRGLLDEYA